MYRRTNTVGNVYQIVYPHDKINTINRLNFQDSSRTNDWHNIVCENDQEHCRPTYSGGSRGGGGSGVSLEPIPLSPPPPPRF